MQSSSSPPSEKNCTIKNTGYFSAPTISTSGRQRTAQACDKCRERKTKCSGEKPVCQRCTNRGLICEYSIREPRVRGPTKARMASSMASSPGREASLESSSNQATSRKDIPYSRSHPPHRNRQPTEYPLNGNYSTSSVGLKHCGSSSPYLVAEARSYSGPCAVHLPHWADVRHNSSPNRNYTSEMGLMNYSSPKLQISAASREAMGHNDPYLALRRPINRQDTLLNCAPNSSLLLEAQQSPRYNTSHELHYDYRAGNVMLEYSASSSPDGSSNGYLSSSTVSSSTPTPPFYPLDHLEHSSSLEGHSWLMTSKYNGDTFGKRGGYGEDDSAGLVPDFSCNKEFGTRDDWCIDSESNRLFSTMTNGSGHVGRDDQNTKVLGALWSNDVPQVELDFRCQSAHRDSMH